MYPAHENQCTILIIIGRSVPGYDHDLPRVVSFDTNTCIMIISILCTDRGTMAVMVLTTKDSPPRWSLKSLNALCSLRRYIILHLY